MASKHPEPRVYLVKRDRKLCLAIVLEAVVGVMKPSSSRVACFVMEFGPPVKTRSFQIGLHF
jgi:hypothetical protein